uniref:Uncharacterized protein n=1 Tax=Cyanistes caeruleus TaxID=156563 RepID=A0A8C0VAU7_CYACU
SSTLDEQEDEQASAFGRGWITSSDSWWRKNATEQKEPQYKPYDNAYFFILFVMLFYSFLALTVFFGYVRSKKAVSKQDPYQEFIEDRNRNKKHCNFGASTE